MTEWIENPEWDKHKDSKVGFFTLDLPMLAPSPIAYAFYPLDGEPMYVMHDGSAQPIPDEEKIII